MMSRRSLPGFALVSSFCICVFIGTALAKKVPKSYPQEGKVIGTGTTEHTDSSGSGGAQSTLSHYSHVYTVETATEVFKLDCGKLPKFVWSSTGAECGGSKKIQIGDVLHFRVQKGWVYIPLGDGQDASEQKLRILSEEMKSNASNGNPASSPSQKTEN